jgi:spore coat polysaccharide biosynthesis protein SpsF
MLLPLAGAPLVQRVLERVARSKRLDTVVLAIPSRDFDAFAPLATLTRAWLYPYLGDDADLVGRYLSAATVFDADLIVRIPCDNPCIEPQFIDQAIDTYLKSNTVFHSTTTVNINGQWIDGLGAEVFSLSRLKILDLVTKGQPAYREHPHRYFQYVLPAPDLSLDVDTQEDYDFIADIYDHCYPQNEQFTIHDILAYLETKKVLA